jgi:hypothetical protein
LSAAVEEEMIERLKAVAREDSDFQHFGASTHRYFRCSPLHEQVVNEFEDRACIDLPEDYRSFITSKISGGAGPGYGLSWIGAVLLPKAPTDDAEQAAASAALFANDEAKKWRQTYLSAPPQDKVALPDFLPAAVREQYAQSTPMDHETEFITELSAPMLHVRDNIDLLRQPFPFSAPVHASREVDQLELPKLSPDAAETVWEQLWAHHGLDGFYKGTLPLCSYGHGISASLVITGPRRGEVWVLHQESMILEPFSETAKKWDGGNVPIPSAPCTFSLWYEYWLADLEKRLGL